MLDKLSFHVKFTLCQLLTSLLQCLFERIKPGICDLEGDSDLPAYRLIESKSRYKDGHIAF